MAMGTICADLVLCGFDFDNLRITEMFLSFNVINTVLNVLIRLTAVLVSVTG